MTDEVRVTITSDASGFTGPTKDAADAAQTLSGALGALGTALNPVKLSYQDFAAALAAAGDKISKITPEMLGMGSSTSAMSAAIFAATAQTRAAAVSFNAISTAGLGVDAAFRSAADSATVFSKALNPTPLQQLRTLMGSEVPPAFQRTQLATQQVISTLFGLDAGFKPAAESARVFMQALDPSPLRALQTMMASTLPGASKVTQTSIHELIATMNGATGSFKSAGDSAAVFLAAVNPTPLKAFRDAMAQINDSAGVTWQSLQQNIDAANRIGNEFKSAADSAAIFNKALDPTPLKTLRVLMGEDMPTAANKLVTNFQAIIDSSTGVDRSFKSAAESADVFTREINRIPLAQLRTNLSAVAASPAWRTLQQNIDTANGIGRAFNSAAESAKVFNAALDPTPLQKMRGLMAEDIPQAAHGSAGGISNITREIIVLGHEAISGRFSRIPGSLMVLMEYSGSLTSKLGALASSMTAMGWAGAAGAAMVVAGLALVITRALEARTALMEVSAAAALMGRSTEQAALSAQHIRTSLQDAGMGRSDIDKVNASVARTPGLTDALRESFGKLAPAMQAAFPGETVDKYFTPLMQAAAGGASAVKSYLTEIDGLTDANIRALAVADSQNDKQAAGKILLEVMQNRLDGYNAALEKRKQVLEEINVAGGDFPPVTMGMLPQLKLPQSTLPAAQAEDPEQVRRAEGEQKLLAPTRERAALVQQIAELTEKVSKASGIELTDAREALKIAQGKLASMRDPGDATWVAKQEADLNLLLEKVAATATSAKKLAEDENKTRIKFWTEAANQAGLSEQQITTAHANATRARLALAREELQAGAAAAKKSVTDRIADLSAEQAAEHDNYEKVIALQQQKLAILQAAGAAYHKERDTELARLYTLEREHAAKVTALAEQSLAKTRQEHTSEITAKKAELDEEVAEGTLSKAQEMAVLRAFANEKHALDLQGLESLLATLNTESDAYKKLYDSLRVLKQQWVTEDKKLNRDAVQDLEKQWESATAPIGNAFSTSMNGVIQGTTTLSAAVGKMAQSIVLSYADMGIKAAIKWATHQAAMLFMTQHTQVAETSATAAGATARGAIGTSETATQNAGLLTRVARWIFGETAKTAASTAGAGTRAGVAAGETATENAGLIVRIGRWIANQLGLTAATTTGVETRNLTQTEADAQGLIQTGLTNSAEAMSFAALGATAAGASVAAIPVTGWAMAPGVAGETYAMLSAFAGLTSLATGAWNVPRDMAANLHAGEMVVPQSYAAGMRQSGGGGSSQSFTYAPNVSGGGDMTSMMRQQAAGMKSYMWHATRNGRLAMAGR